MSAIGPSTTPATPLTSATISDPPTASSSKARKKNQAKKAKKKKAQGLLTNYFTLSTHPLQLYPLDGDVVSESNRSGVLIHKINSKEWGFKMVVNRENQDVTLGRSCIATRALTPGTLLFTEHPFIWSLHDTTLTTHCHTCTLPLHSIDEIPTKQQRNNMCGCHTCGRVYYCSEECKERAKTLHAIECPILKTHLDEIALMSSVHIDLVRIIISFLAKQKLDAITSTSTSSSTLAPSLSTSSSTPTFTSDYSDALDLINHVLDMPPQDVTNMRHAAIALLNIMHVDGITAQHVVEMMCTINSNSHALHSEERADAIIGVGLFPLASCFDHSCYPNVTFTNHGNRLQYRVIADVRAGEELTVNYIELYQSRAQRQQQLQISKAFQCRCRRCTLRPISATEKSAFQHDVYLDAIKCQRDTCDGVYVHKNDGYQCYQCEHVLEKEKWEAIQASCLSDYNTAVATYTNESSPPSTSLTAIERVFRNTKDKIHPAHELLYKLYLPLMNCCGAIQDYKKKVSHARDAVSLLDPIFPTHHIEKLPYYDVLNTSLLQLVAASRNIPTSIMTSYQQERSHVMIMRHTIVCANYGAESVQAKAIAKEMIDQQIKQK